jgi:pup-like protein
MPQTHINTPNNNDDDTTTPETTTGGQTHINTSGVDDLLHEIDGLLETNAEDFVRSYIQKGGQ